jgi:hypothetical protein
VRIDALRVRLRPRTPVEASDLGVRLCQSTARSVYACYALAALPIAALAVASGEIALWLPFVVVWCAKPWLDRTILFVLSRAAFGQPTRPADVWRAQRQVWWKQLASTWTVRRLSPWRSLTQAVYQLEEFSILNGSQRVRQIRHKHAASAAMLTSVFSLSETVLTVALVSLVFWFAPAGRTPELINVFAEQRTDLMWALPAAYAIAVLFLEPFYVAAGFAMYLNRRAELEAWDIEQEFRRAFAH